MDQVVFRRAQLLGAGWTDGGLTRGLRTGLIVRVAWDRYVLPGVPPPLEQVLAQSGTRAALSHASAARAWGLPASDPRPHIVVPHGSHRPARATSDVVVHQRRRWSAEELAGIAVTDPVTTVVDMLRSSEPAEAVAVADAAIHAALVTPRGLAEITRERAPGNARARRALALTDGRSESPLESRLRLLLALGGLPPDDLQHDVREQGRFVARVDLWYDSGLVVEADGFEFHRERADFVADRRKGQAFARLGLHLLRFSWDDVHQRPDHAVATVGCVLANLERGGSASLAAVTSR